MRLSKLRKPKYPMGFIEISKIPGVCSAVTLSSINSIELRLLSKEEVMRNIEAAVMQQNKDIRTVKIKTVQITLNHDRFWCWGTPWKFAYSYKGNMGNCSVFYINFK